MCSYDPNNGLAHLRQVHGVSPLSCRGSPLQADAQLAEARWWLKGLVRDSRFDATAIARLSASNAALQVAWNAQRAEEGTAWANQGKCGWDSMAAAHGTRICEQERNVEDGLPPIPSESESATSACVHGAALCVPVPASPGRQPPP